jgi:tetratricopeptide (TPR) repeat protein
MSVRHHLALSRGRHVACVVFVMLVLVLAACRPKNTDEPLSEDAARAEIARLQKHLDRHPDDNDAWRDLAHLHWLHVNEPDAAIEILDRLVDAGDPTAQLSRTVMAHARLETDTVWKAATALIQAAASGEGSKAERAYRVALAEVGVRFLDDAHGSRPGDDEEFIRFFEGLDLEAIPVEVAQPLISTRARIARRHGKDYRQFYDAEGCVRSWVAGPVEGHFGELELSIRDDDREGFTLDDTAKIAPLSCVVRVWNPEPKAGIRRMRAVIEPTDNVMRLELAAQNAMRVYLDGQLIHRTDVVDRWPARQTLLDVPVDPGPHLLEVRTSIPEDRAWFLVRATQARGKPVKSRGAGAVEVREPFAMPRKGLQRRTASWPASAGPLDSNIYLPLREYLAVDDALADGDSDRAEQHVGKLEEHGSRFPEAHLILADFEDGDPSRGRNASASRRQRALEQALMLDSRVGRARLTLLEHRLGQGEQAEVVEELKKLPQDQLDTIDGQLLRWQTYLERGSDYLAEQALARAVELNPSSCEVLLAQRRMARRLQQVDKEDEIVAKLDHCAGTLKVRSRLAHRRGETERAGALLDRQLERVPDDLDGIESRASIALTEARYPTAIKLFKKVLEFAPFRATAHISIADAYAHSADAGQARAYVRHAIDQLPHNGRLREIGETVGIDDPLMRWRVDGIEVLDTYRRGGKRYEGVKEVLVLDRDVAEVYASGGQRHIVHQIAHMLTKEALDTYGEVQLPEGARILSLQSIKPDGTLVEPELIPGKDGLSLRDLEIGDFVEMEYVIEREPVTALPGHIDLSRFRFQSLDTPYHRSELLVVAPKDMEVLVESRNGAPKAKRSIEDDKQIVQFLAKEVPRRGSEPQTRSLLDELPMVRVYTQLEVETWLKSIALQMRSAQRSNPELRRQAHEIAAGLPTEFAKVDALYQWIMDNVEEAGSLSTHATRTLAAREGNRLMLLRAMIREMGIRSEVWLARDAFGPTIQPKGHPMVEAYEAPMLAVWVDDHEVPLILATIAKSLPPGYLLPAYSGTDALRLQLAADERPPGRVRLPKTPKRLLDRRSYDLTFTLDADGNGELSGTIELQGMEALLWRNVLERVDEDQRGERFQEGELSVIARGASLDLETLDIENEDPVDAALLLRFSAGVTGVGVTQDGELVVPAALVPMNLGLGYTQLPERHSGMVVPYAPRQDARITIEFTGGTLQDQPGSTKLNTDYGTYSRKVTDGGKGQSRVVIETSSTLRPGIIEPAAYAGMSKFTGGIQTAEQAVLRVR